MIGLLLLSCQPDTPPAVDLAAVAPELSVSLDYPRWPEPGSRLTPPAVTFPPDFGVRRVFLDPGHGVGRNSGNTSAYCESEADVMLALAGPLAAALEATEHFTVRQSRRPGQEVEYRDRMQAAADDGAEVFISLHSDSRGELYPWEPEPGKVCYRSFDTPGFSVLWSDEGPLADSRQALARQLSMALTAAGFQPYDGGQYGGYDPDAVPGVFVDRHRPRRRIMLLRRPTMPSVIIETHHAMDPASAARFRESEVQAALHAAVIAGLVAFFSQPPPTAP